MTAVQEIKVPDIGNYKDVPIIELSIKVGDSVTPEQTLLTLETEKAAMEIPSPIAGKIQTLKVKVGDKISKGDVIALVEAQGVKEAVKPTITAEPAPAKTTEVEQAVNPNTVHAGPATRRLARELNVDLNQVTGSGRKGRILTQDLDHKTPAIEAALQVDFNEFGATQLQALTRIKKWTAKNLHRNWITIPHVTQFEEADITELDEFRKTSKALADKAGVKLTLLPFIIKALISSLKAYPQFNASLSHDGNELILKQYFNIGVAVDTPQGLVVPVIKQADTKGIFELAQELAQVSQTAREGKLPSQAMQGSSFTISSLGSIGGTAFTPIINAPDVAILGLSKAQIKPAYQDKQWVPRLLLPLSLSYDHRVIDGVEAAKFCVFLAQCLADIRRLLF